MSILPLVKQIAFYVVFLSAVALNVFAQNMESQVDSIYEALTTQQRVGQLFMIRAHSNLGADHVASVKQQVERYQVGSMCFFQGTPKGHAELIREYQQLSKQPLLMAIDAEWGGGMRFKESGMSFPRQLMLGAIQDNSLLYRMGLEVGDQLLSIGLNVNFAPVVDVNVNPANPVINDRSFGEDRLNVTSKAYHYMLGLQEAGMIACAKHFPGHGDTDVDSHLDLPVINHRRGHLDSIELFPFKVLINKGVQSVMVAHLHVPELDDRPNIPTTLSGIVIDSLLRGEMGFEGLVFTDALEMKAVTKHFKAGELEIRAINAGNDVLCLPNEMDKAFPAVLHAVESGAISQDRLAQSVKRIIRSKLALGLYDKIRIEENADMFAPSALALKEELIENALTAVRNEKDVLPIRDIEDRRFTSLMIGTGQQTLFQTRLASYAPVNHMSVASADLAALADQLLETLAENDVVFVGLAGMSKYQRDDFGISQATRKFITDLSTRTEVVLTIFGSPYSLKFFEDIPTVLMAFEPDLMVQDIAAQALFGAIPVKGRLPITASPGFPVNHGLMLPSLGRLGYGVPERVGLSTDSLVRIASLAQEMIEGSAAPGCQILIAKDGKIVYSRAFGHFTYQKRRVARTSDLYDVASVTKVAATTLAMMRLYDEGAISPYRKLGDVLDDCSGTNKENILIRDVMAHQAGLQPWIPFHEATVTGRGRNSKPSPEYYSQDQQGEFTVQVANNMYLRRSQRDSIWRQILDSDLRDNRKYRYSDLGFYIIAEIIERQTEASLDQFCDEEFYRPLGLQRTCYLPLERFSRSEIVPTEEDKSFRKQRLQGFVHDPGSALMGGVGGHAGLFSNAEGLAVIMQMLLNGGAYGGRRYFDKETIDLFTTRVERSTRRALGFDMKQLDKNDRIHTSELASDDTYGHTGFTGTCVWNDRKHNMVFVFLSNRTYPSARSNKMSKLEFRERFHTLVYTSMVF